MKIGLSLVCQGVALGCLVASTWATLALGAAALMLGFRLVLASDDARE
jgi:hypothetical protein